MSITDAQVHDVMEYRAVARAVAAARSTFGGQQEMEKEHLALMKQNARRHAGIRWAGRVAAQERRRKVAAGELKP